jgi:hypothetical protein
MRKIRELNKKIRENIIQIDKHREATSIDERRTGQKDRRKQHTYLAHDRRSGIADRRKGLKLK